MKRAAALVAVVVAVMLSAPVARGYLRFGKTVNNQTVPVRWNNMPVKYFVTNRDVVNVTAAQLQTSAQAGFAAWAKIPGVAMSSQFSGFTSAEPGIDDGVNVIGFQLRAELDRTLGATTFVFDDVSGQLIEADIFLNSAFPWSSAAAGSGRFDVQSVVTHELGHFHGLGHSALGETEVQPTGGRKVDAKQAVMFPIAFPPGNVDDRTPKADDAAGMGEIYGTAAFSRQYGQINGRVTLAGKGVFGAHVTVFNSSTGALVSGFCLDSQGNFSIGGLVPGIYIVRAEPLDDADLDSFFDTGTVVNIAFKPAYYGNLVTVPAGGTAPKIEIKVVSK